MHFKHRNRSSLAALSLALGVTLAGHGALAFGQSPSPAAATHAQTYDFDIASGPLDQALLNLSRNSGQTIAFQQDLVQGLTSAAVRGRLTTEQALQQALRGSALDAVPSGDGGWVLRRAAKAPAASIKAAPAAAVALAPVPGDVALEKVVVTGSRIARAQVEGPSPVTVISGEEITSRGYKNVYDAIASQTQNTGMTQGEDYGNTFQPAASALNLRGLGPNHTLVLINGRRVADYPTAYDGAVNFTNLANIPAVMIERIEILSSGASAVYGSDAIAGVVNIILKDKISGVDVNLRGGYAERGGGDNQRLQISGGDSWGDFDGVFGLELTNRQPIWSNQRGFMTDGPAVNVGYRRNLDSGAYLGPGCAAYGGIYNGKLGNTGNRCTTNQYYNDYSTLQAEKENYDGYTRGTWHFSDSGKVFADLMFGFDHTQNNTRGPSFTSPDFINQNTGNLERWSRNFASE